MTIPNKKAFITILFRLTILSLIFTSFFSCTVQKRVHQKGYYVSWQGKKTQPKQIASANKRDPGESLPKIKAIELPEEKVSASVTKTETPKKPSHSLPNDSCDVLLYKDGSKINVKLLEISEKEIRYKRCDNPNGPVYISSKSELYMIKHRNGQEELVRVAEPPRRQPTVDPSEFPRKTDYRENKNRRVVHPAAPFALIFGILSMIVGYLFLILLLAEIVEFTFIFVVGAIALAAVIFGSRAIRDIGDHPQHYKGKGLAMPGFIFGLIVLGIAAFLALLVLVVFV